MEHQKKEFKGPDIVSDIDCDICGSHTPDRDTRNRYPILTPISGYHVTDIGTHDIVPDIASVIPNPDIRYEVYDIGDRMTRYRVCTRLRYPISGHMRHVPISGQMKTRAPSPISEHMTRYRVTIGPDIGFGLDIG